MSDNTKFSLPTDLIEWWTRRERFIVHLHLRTEIALLFLAFFQLSLLQANRRERFLELVNSSWVVPIKNVVFYHEQVEFVALLLSNLRARNNLSVSLPALTLNVSWLHTSLAIEVCFIAWISWYSAAVFSAEKTSSVSLNFYIKNVFSCVSWVYRRFFSIRRLVIFALLTSSLSVFAVCNTSWAILMLAWSI